MDNTKKTAMDSDLTYYDVNKQLMNNERRLDPIELNLKVAAIRKELEKNIPNYLMLLCHDRRDFTIFDFRTAGDAPSALSTFEKDLKECLLNRGTTLTIAETEDDNLAWEIWLRDENSENFCYYLFDYSNAVITY